MKIGLILFFILSTHIAFSQALSDSLIKKYANAPDSVKLKNYLDVAGSLQNKDQQNCEKLCDEIIRIGKENKNYHYQAEGELVKGLTNYFAGNYEKTLACYLSAMKLFETANEQSGKARVYNELGVFYMKQKKPQDAQLKFDEAFAIAQKENNEGLMSTALNNQGMLAQERQEHKTAIDFFTKARILYEKRKDSIGVSYAMDYSSISYAGLKDFDKAISLQTEALAIRLALKDSNAAALSYINLAEIKNMQGKYKEAEVYILQCLSISEKIKFKELTSYAYKMLAEGEAKTGDMKQAYEYYLKYSALNEELFNETKSKQINELQTKYETEKKIQQIELLTAENELQDSQKAKQRNLFLGFFAVLLAVFIALYNYLKRKKQKEIDDTIIHEKEERNKAIIEAEEKERVRIARDLHDGVAQTMVAAKMQLEAFMNQVAPEERQATTLQNAFSLIQDASTEVRAVSHSMIPNALLKSGLVAAVRDFINRMGNTKLAINLEVLGLNQRMNDSTETVIFRVLQELVNNIVKHANANKITIQLIKDNDEFTMIVEDNGVGFDTKKINDQTGIGLKNITSRVEYLNGTINFDSTPGHGTTVVIEIPLV